MGDLKPRVLLIGESAQGSSYLASRLERRGCHCRLATSSEEVLAILRDDGFDIVLGAGSLLDQTLHSIMDILEGSGTSVFYSCAVEDGCWWLPALRWGEKCFGSPALRPNEFVALLDETIKVIRGDVLPARVSLMSVSPAPPKSTAANERSAEEGQLAKRKTAG
jgi:hypothetical protein